MTRPSHSWFWTKAAALALTLNFGLLLPGQDTTKRGIPKDWSMHHVVFSKPGPAALPKVANDPRYLLQQQIRAAAAAPPSLPAPPTYSPAAEPGPEPPDMAPPFSGPLPRGVGKALIPATGKELLPPPAKQRHIHKDWSVGEGTNGTSGLGQFPATFTQTASPCGSDYAVYNTGLGGSAMQATIVAFINIYANCNAGVPTVYFAYNTGSAAIVTSLAISRDGSQIAFIQGNPGSAASLVILKWSASGGSVSAPVTPSAVAPASYRTCTKPCQTTITFGNSGSDTYSSPFYDFSSDVFYVGDDGGVLHKFSGVFNGTPAEVTTGGWPVQVSSATTGGSLGSPLYDTVSHLVFVGDYLASYASACAPTSTNLTGSCGFLYSVSATGAVIQSTQFDVQYGLVDAPIIDSSTEQVFVFVGSYYSNNYVFQMPATFTAGYFYNYYAYVGAGYQFMLSGTFDNNYFNTGTGNMYVVGGTGAQNNTLYQLPVSSGNLTYSSNTGPAVASNYTNGYYAAGLQVTEFYTGTHDYIFLGVLVAGNNVNVGQVAGYDVTSGTITTTTTPTGTIAAQGGSSGIVVDNALSTAQNIYYSSLLNAASCTTSGSGGCAVQVIQSAP